jgi:DNA-binding MarR family transcriptional regulator
MDPERTSHPSSAVALCDFFTEYARLERHFSRQFGVTPQLARTLFYIHDERPCCVRTLTEMLGIHPTSTSKFLSRLERRGLLTRSMDRVDHRVERIALTAEGVRKVEALREQFQALASDLDHQITSHFRSCTNPAPLAHMAHLITDLITTGRPMA